MTNRRRSDRVSLLIATVSSLLAIGPAPRAMADDWPGFLGPRRDGTSRETGLARQWPKNGPPIRWKHPAGRGFSGPVVVGGRVVLFHQLGGDATVSCLGVDAGKSIWSRGYPCRFVDGYGAGPGPRATPIVHEGLIFTIDGESTLQCLKLADGTEVWRRELAKEYDIPEGFFGVSSTPIIEGDLLLLNLGAPKNAGFAAIDWKTGEVKWTSGTDTSSYASPIVIDTLEGRRALFFSRSGLVGMEPATGKQTFFFPFRARINASVNAATPLHAGKEIFLSSEYNTGAVLLHLEGDKLAKRWGGQAILSNHYNTSVLHDGYLYGIDGRQEGGARLRCVDWKTGKVAWTHEGTGCASILLVDGHLILLDETGTLTLAAATPDAFTPLATAPILAGTCRAHPAFADGILYATDGQHLVAVDLREPVK